MSGHSKSVRQELDAAIHAIDYEIDWLRPRALGGPGKHEGAAITIQLYALDAERDRLTTQLDLPSLAESHAYLARVAKLLEPMTWSDAAQALLADLIERCDADKVADLVAMLAGART